MANSSRRTFISIMTATLLAGSLSLAGEDPTPAAPDHFGAVFAMTNAADTNEVVMYRRLPDGTLEPAGRFPTGGRGTGGSLTAPIDPLGSQGSLVLSHDRRWLFAVNAGSNEVSAFEVRSESLVLRDVRSSGGQFPVSLTQHGNVLYVLNVGGEGNITGFMVRPRGRLTPLAGSTRPLDLGGTNPPDHGVTPVQIQFAPNGRALVVTYKGSREIKVYPMARGRRPAAEPVVSPSEGLYPFGFTFVRRRFVLVTEPLGAVSSYRLERDGSLEPVSSSVANFGLDTCWIAGRGPFAYATNTSSHDISGYRTGPDGSIALLDADGVTFRYQSLAYPTDAAVTPRNRFLYTLNAGTGTVGMLRIEPDGALVFLGEIEGLPAFDGAQGIAAF